jgi:hypothetical protein
MMESDNSVDEILAAYEGIKRLKLILSINNELRDRVIHALSPEIQSLFPELEILGVGSESIVFVDPSNKDRAISIGIKNKNIEGVVPFSVSKHFHDFVKALYPENTPELYSVSGNIIRDTSRERIRGKKQEDCNSYWAMGRKMINELLEMKVTDFGLDLDLAVDNNVFIGEGSNNNIYVDMFDCKADSVKDIDMDKVKVFYQEKFQIDDYGLSSDAGWKTIIRSVRVLKELATVDHIFNYMESMNYLDKKNRRKCYEYLSGPIFNRTVDSFHFFDTSEDDRSKKTITTWVLKATEAIMAGNHEYRDKSWIS